MKFMLAVIALLILSGCKTTDVIVTKFPEVPVELMTACPALIQLDPNTTKLSDVLTVVSDNYHQYHQCRAAVDGWIQWYTKQQANISEVKP